MDGKRSVKNALKNKLTEYLGLYTEGPPVGREEAVKIVPHLLKKAGTGIGITVLTYLFASSPLAYSAIPLGFALFCSLKSYVVWSYFGLLFASVTEMTGLALPLALIYTALFLGRYLIWRSYGDGGESFALFGESIGIRISEGLSASLLISAYRMAMNGFLYYDIFGGIFEVLTVPVFIYIFNCAVDKKYKHSAKREAGWVSLFAVTAFSLKDFSVFGLSVAAVFAIFMSLYVSKTGGLMRGGMYGLICGLACNIAFSPVYALCGMVSGLLWNIGVPLAVTLTCSVGILCGIYVDGIQSIGMFAPDFLCAALIFMPTAKYGLLPVLSYNSDMLLPSERMQSISLSEKKRRDTEARFEALSTAFSALSEVFYTLSDRVRRPGIVDAKELCDRACDEYCPRCAFHCICWENEYTSTLDVFSKMSKALCDNGRLERNAVVPYMLERCKHIDKMIEYINHEHALLIERKLKENKTEIFAMDYSSVSRLLEEALTINNEEYIPDTDMCRRLREASAYMNFYARDICVYGKRKISVLAGGIDLSRVKLSANEIRQAYENICGVKLTNPTFDIESDSVTMSLESARSFDVEYATAYDCKKNEKFCGDVICMFENDQDYFYSLISDGMGSGYEAALTSRLCGVYLKEMLSAGNSKPVSLEMLNNFIRSKNTECFATIDLLEVDLLRGKAGFIKSGAAASFVLRGDRIFRIASNTMPVGITREMNAEEVKFDLQDGDVIVMMSDGVGQSDEDTVRLSDMLTFSWEDDLQVMADKILEKSKAVCKRSDDISVGLLRVKKV